MVSVSAGSQTSINTDELGVTGIQGGTVAVATPNQLVINYGDGRSTDFRGNFTYDAASQTLTGGTIASVTNATNGVPDLSVSQLNLPVATALNWAAAGTDAEAIRDALLSGNDSLTGSDFNDTMRGYAGDDTINGGRSDDLLDGGRGVNIIDGGDGIDTVVRHSSRADSGAVKHDGEIYVIDANGYDRLTNVEFIQYTDQTVAGATAPVFDGLSYLAANPDLAAAYGTDGGDAAFDHYRSFGWSEGRTLTFNAAGYLADNPDLFAAFGTNTSAATRHYIEMGRLEGRQTDFDSMSYLAANPDLIAAFGTDTTAAALHYAQFGRNEGRSLEFDASSYLARYPDLRAAFGTDLQAATNHYVQFGYQEGRDASPLTTGTAFAAADTTQPHATLSIA
nr:hypothetical protein [uncultured Azospirillum sp.]